MTLFTASICFCKTTRKAEAHETKINFPLLPILLIQIGLRVKKLLPEHKKVSLIEHETVSKLEENNIND
jgi:hypothetical protein